MGSIIRLNTTFNNAKLKTLQDYDASLIKEQILALPTLRAFYDATDSETMTLSGNLVTQLKDLSPNQLHFTQVTNNAPSYDAKAFGHTGGLVFTGAQWLTANHLLNGQQVGSVVIFAKGDSDALNVLISSSTHATVALYTRSNAIGAMNGGAVARANHAHIRPTNIILSYNAAKNFAVIQTDHEYPVSNSTSGNVNIPSGHVNLGRWSDSRAEMYVGKIGHVILFNEDLSKNQAVLDLINEYAKRKYRFGMSI